MLRIITCAAFVSLIIGVLNEGLAHGWMEGSTIIMAVVIIVCVTAGNNYMKEKQFEKLNKKAEVKSLKLNRCGEVQYINSAEITVGDIMHVSIGDILSVDGVLVKGTGLWIDESSITGETQLIEKKTMLASDDVKAKATAFMNSGSKVMDGQGLMMACAVGKCSQYGQLKLKLQEEAEPTPLQEKLESVAHDIGKAGITMAFLTLAALFINWGLQVARGQTCFICISSLNFLVKSLIIGITIIVVAVPEGLPLAVTIALAYSVGKMREENNLVRNLSSCEIMGGANNICSDKTGTLTQNLMTVVKLYFTDSMFDFPYAQGMTLPKPTDVLADIICNNSNANPVLLKNKKFDQLGNKTECALIELAYNLGYDYKIHRKLEDIAIQFPFSSARKKMSTIKFSSDKQKCYVQTKGASEIILSQCTKILNKNGEIEALSEEKKKYIIENVINNFASQALRTIGIAYKEIDKNTLPEDLSKIEQDKIDKDLILVAISGIKDPLRPGIIEAIKVCKKAGITVRMVTGDNIETATAISLECGIITQEQVKDQEYAAMEGKKFRELLGVL